jgi:cytochrome c oxidase cbb3-type subunit III
LAVAAYIRSVVETIGGQGRPPSVGKEAPSILVGDAGAGQAVLRGPLRQLPFRDAAICKASREESPPQNLQTRWVSGGGRRFRAPAAASPRTVTVTVTLPGGEKVEGRLVRIDDFLVTVGLADGTVRTFRRDEDVPKVEVHDPMKPHRDLMAVYTDKDIHDVTAYLVTLK